MHDDTCRALARVLARRNDGFMQMILESGDHDADHNFLEELSVIAGRPMLMNVVQAIDHRPEIHRKVLAWLKRCRERGAQVVGQGVTTDAGFTFTFKDWNLFDDSPAWCEATTGTIEERLAKLADPERRKAMKNKPPRAAIGPFEQTVITGPKLAQHEAWRDHTLAFAAEKSG
jgi:N-acyl-D-aspartate/D-glutamate deacylase